uniref:ABC transporter substrate-binding protein n=1 Tax=Thermosphaera aggregans TaxID=54254 RepID=A0A7C2FPY9_9CREN
MKKLILALLIPLLVLSIIYVPITTQAQEAVKGPASDKVIMKRVPIDHVPSAIENKEIDLYMYSLRPAQAEQLKEIEGVVFYQAPAGLIDIILNPAPVAVEVLEGTFDIAGAAAIIGVPKDAVVGLKYNETHTFVYLGAKPGVGINPFAFRDVRFAMNYLIDRETAAYTILKGYAVPMYTFLSQFDPDYSVIADIIAMNEFKYDPAYADQLITQALQKVGAKKVGGKWLYDGQPISLTFIIRIEDERYDIGKMIASDLEMLGFTIVVKEMGVADAIALLYGTDPAEFQWHMYTEGWGKSGIDKYDSGTIAQFCAPWVGYMPGWQEPTFWNYEHPELDEITMKIYQSQYKSKEERDMLYRDGTRLCIEESIRIWVVTRLDTWVVWDYVKGLTKDLGAGLRGIWNLREAYVEGRADKTLKVGHLWVWTSTSEWNIWGGFTDVYSVDWERVTYDPSMWTHPFNGLPIPFRVSYVVLTEGPEGNMTVPTTAKIFNAATDTWENVPENTTAVSKVVFDLSKYIGAKWHNGREITMADLIGYIAMIYDLVYDEYYSTLEARIVSNTKPWLDTVKGWEFDIQNKRMTVYVDYWHFDENYIASWATVTPINPIEIHVATFELALDRRNETNLVLYRRSGYQTFSLVYPDHVTLVKNTLATYTNNNAVLEKANKYADGLLTMTEWNQRIQADLEWINTYNLAWISNGPFMLTKMDTVANEGEMTAFRDPTYPFKPGDWYFGSPTPSAVKIVTIVSDIPNKIVPGREVVINIEVAGVPPLHLKYMLKDPSGQILVFTDAEKIDDFHFRIVMNPEFTNELKYGGRYSLLLIVTSDVVATPEIAKIPLDVVSMVELLDAQKEAFQRAVDDLRNTVQALSNKVDSLPEKLATPEDVSALKSAVDSLSTVVYATLGMVVITLIISVIPLIRKK